MATDLNTLEPMMTVRQVARRLAVDAGKLLLWIKRGELRAINVAANAGGRPRYRIDNSALDEFLMMRSGGAARTSKPSRRRPARKEQVISFF